MGRKVTRLIATIISVMILTTTVLFASPMKDVSANHWAYHEILEMQKRGLLVTNSQNEFFPNDYVTYFHFSQILAKATGYEDEETNPNMDPALKKIIKENFAKQKSIIEAHEKNYKHWQKDANPEIAYLLGKGYLTPEDLGRFMSKSTSGMEVKRGVRKQESIVYLVRILHKAETAKNDYVSTGFTDEASIDAQFRPYVGYFKKLGIINGDGNGNFGPTVPITRATLSKMLIDTLKIKENPSGQPGQADKPLVPEKPVTDQGLEGKLTKMISKGEGGYYIVLEVEPTKIHTYSIEPTAVVETKGGETLSLGQLKAKIDAKDGEDIHVTAKVNLIGTTEYMTHVKLINHVESPEEVKPDQEDTDTNKEEEDKDKDLMLTEDMGSIHSILMSLQPEITIQTPSGKLRTYQASLDTQVYNQLNRREISLWDLRLNQKVDLSLQNKEIKSINVTGAAPSITLTGTITQTSTNGDTIDVKVFYDVISQQSNFVRTIKVPMTTRIIDGTIQRGRKDLAKDMQVVVVFGENASLEPDQIVILAK